MKVLLAKILSVVDPENEEQRSWVGKYVNDIVYIPYGFEFHETVEDAVEEVLEYTLCAFGRLYDIEEARMTFHNVMSRKHLYGFGDIEYWEVEV